MKPALFIFSGLPASGKSSLAKRLAREYRAVWLRIDTIEQALRELCEINVQGEGYRLAYRIAADNLKLGLHVVADSCNPWELTRREWNRTAKEGGAAAIDIEVVCSDSAEHRKRVESRESEVAGLKLPAWDEVCTREYHPWSSKRIIIDTASRSAEESFEELKRRIKERLFTYWYF